MSWQLALVTLFGALVILAALVLIVHEIREERRYRKSIRINPMYRVGDDAKDFP